MDSCTVFVTFVFIAGRLLLWLQKNFSVAPAQKKRRLSADKALGFVLCCCRIREGESRVIG